ncbi:MAG TPA: SDR family oxidoreductase [Dehalococcoidia bacterium]|jgi:NAD(P)-dependent dehydrogenase (short-subunit alcohol dehydrogenase family)
MLLDGKNAIIYGAGGGIGGGVARTFAREGAHIFLVGRTREKLERLAAEIAADGGRAEVAVLDALNERAVEEHMSAVAASAGSVDVSFNLVSRGDVQGTRLLEVDVDDFLCPIVTGARTNFITARAAARRMVEQGSGVILLLNSGSGGPQVATPPEAWPMGGTGPADAALDSFIRYLAAEVGPRGVRVAGLWTAAVSGMWQPESEAEPDPLEAVKDRLVGEQAMLRRRPSLQQVADTAAWLASDRASGITAAIVNVSSGITSH